jgi:flagellar basal-body rod modification protein FlgD
MATINPGITSQVAAAQTNNSSSSSTGVEPNTIAGNFQTFLQLLTTQLKNQNPLDPLDTNQFTAQLVQFAQVEQQLKSNDQLSTLVSLQKTAQATQALEYVGQTVAVDGDTTPLTDGEATWRLDVSKPVNATINIMSSTGQTVYTVTRALEAGKSQPFTAKDATGQSIAIPTEIQAVVDSADLTQTPPLLSIAGSDYTLDKVKRIIRN